MKIQLMFHVSKFMKKMHHSESFLLGVGDVDKELCEQYNFVVVCLH